MNQVDLQTDDGKLGEIVDEVLSKMARGEVIDVEQYAREHPDVADVLRHALPALRAVAQSSVGGTEHPTTVRSQAGSSGESISVCRHWPHNHPRIIRHYCFSRIRIPQRRSICFPQDGISGRHSLTRRAFWSLGPLRSLRALRTLGPLGTFRTLRPFRTLRALWSLWPL